MSAKEDVEIVEVMRSLKTFQNDEYVLQRKRERAAENILLSRLAWLPKNFTVPNIFLQPNKQSVVMQDIKKDNRTLVFVHHPRTAGNHVIMCLNNLSYAKNMAMSPLMNSKNRLLWDTGNPNTVSFQNRIDIHRGTFAFGLCEKLQRKCRYFTFFRDPFESMVSLYNHCLKSGTHEFCLQVKSKSLCLRDWIIENGGLLLNQFLYSSHLCFSHHSNSSADASKYPCWHRQNLENDKLSDNEKGHVANYIARNLRQWFSVIGLFERFEESLSMFDFALGGPFRQCSSKRKVNSTFEEEIQKTNKAHLLSEDDRQIDYNEEYEDEMDILRDDFYVQRALSPAYTIYAEAKRIFKFQRQILYNKLNNV
ncbi:uncharacterized protein LOC133187029 isoform X2 [Saccostrea echinata]|uniref:uncharacterized protein LOC133187029 isoform X2 n=1 Tax=Saccostrea echinata TaxID=191078 RepID=UPI002A8313A9|nr:uncharacterized protein LOC133187029 isoform X2 [Saccostrea echinata]